MKSPRAACRGATQAIIVCERKHEKVLTEWPTVSHWLAGDIHWWITNIDLEMEGQLTGVLGGSNYTLR